MKLALRLAVCAWLFSAMAYAGTITGTVFDDANNNGVLDVGEVKPSGTVTVKLLNSAGTSTIAVITVGASGLYTFTANAGSYQVIVDNNTTTTDRVATPPAGFSFSNPTSGQRAMTLATNTSVSSGNNFALHATTVSGTVFIDADADGALDTGEVPPATTLYAKLMSGAVVTQSALVNPVTGAYSFRAIAAGTYTVFIDTNNTAADVTATPPSTYHFGNPATGSTSITVAAADLTRNFSLLPNMISGFIYQDDDVSGTLNGAEGAAAATVYAKLISGGTVSQVSNVNATTGAYSFSLIANGSYSVIVDNNNSVLDATPTAPTGFIFVEPATGTLAVTVNNNDNTGQNLGIVQIYLVRGRVYMDTNNSGAYEGGETGPISTAYTKLISAGSVIAVTQVTGSGNYGFANVLNGNYTLIVDDNNSTSDTTPTAPSGTNFRSPVTGTFYITVNNASVLDQNFGLVTPTQCRCGYDDGFFTRTAITLDGNMSDWAGVLNDPDNNSCDPLGTADRDYPIQSTGRDLTQFAFTWDATYFSAITTRAGSSSNTNNFIYYGDGNNNGLMETGEPMIVVGWQGSNRSVAVSIGTYVASASGGDPLVDGTNYADGYDLPGVIANLPNSPNYSGNWGSADGTQMEWRVPWTDLGTASGAAISWHVSTTNSNPGAGSFPAQLDDNMGGCGQCPGTNQYGGAAIGFNQSVTASRNTTAYLPATVTNSGNGLDRFDLATTASGSFTPTAFRYYRDLGTVGVYDAGTDTLLTDSDADGVPDTGPLTINASLAIIIAADIPNAAGTATLVTTATSNFIPTCSVNFTPASATVTNSVSIVPGISGTVYFDANHNASRDAAESGTGLTLYVKAVSSGSPSGPASGYAAVDPSSGYYTMPSLPVGTYLLVLDTNATLSDVNANAPAGWVGTEAATLSRTATLGTVDLVSENFGLYNGSRITGRVFLDNGITAGVPNNGLQDGGETVLSGVTVRATDTSSSVYDSVTTDGSGTFVLYVPAAAGTVWLTEVNAANYISTGAGVGDTTGVYTRATDTISFTSIAGTNYSGITFGDVPPNDFSTDNTAAGQPGSTVFYPHNYTAQTGGQVNFSITRESTPAATAFNEVLYQDSDCNNALDASEPLITAAITLTAGQKICLLIKEFIPASAPINAQNKITITASFTYTNSAPVITATASHVDLTIVGAASNSGLKLEKTVDQATALPGTTLTYTLRFTNQSSEALSNILIFDTTPAYTTFVSATCPGTLPASLTACAVTTAPAVGATGNIRWTMTGTLDPTSTGTVTFQVKIN